MNPLPHGLGNPGLLACPGLARPGHSLRRWRHLAPGGLVQPDVPARFGHSLVFLDRPPLVIRKGGHRFCRNRVEKSVFEGHILGISNPELRPVRHLLAHVPFFGSRDPATPGVHTDGTATNLLHEMAGYCQRIGMPSFNLATFHLSVMPV